MGMVTALVLAGFVFLPPERLIQRFARFVSTDGLTSDGRADPPTVDEIRQQDWWGGLDRRFEDGTDYPSLTAVVPNPQIFPSSFSF